MDAKQGEVTLGKRTEAMLLFAARFQRMQGRPATLEEAALGISLVHREHAFYHAIQMEKAGLLWRESAALSRMLIRPLRLTTEGEARAEGLQSRPGAQVAAQLLMGLINEQARYYKARSSRTGAAIGHAMRRLQQEARGLLEDTSLSHPAPPDVSESERNTEGGEEIG